MEAISKKTWIIILYDIGYTIWIEKDASKMDIFYTVVFILAGLGVPFYFAIKNSHPKNVLRKIFTELKMQPQNLWYHFFTYNGFKKWNNDIDFKIKDIKDFEIIDYTYEDYIWKYKVKLTEANRELYYYFELAKNPAIGVRSRWIIHNIYK